MAAVVVLRVDPVRVSQFDTQHATDIFVRARVGERIESVDIAVLDRESLATWLRDQIAFRGPEFAVRVVLVLLEHGPR